METNIKFDCVSHRILTDETLNLPVSRISLPKKRHLEGPTLGRIPVSVKVLSKYDTKSLKTNVSLVDVSNSV